MRLALFDLDHTLIPFDSDYAWGEFTVKLGWRDGDSFSKANDGFYADYKAGTLDIHRYVRFATDAVREHGLAASQQAHERFMEQVIRPAIGEPARALLRGHPAVKDVAVRLHDFSGQPRLKAYVVPWPEADPGTLAEHLRQWAAECLPAAARPAHVAVGLALPVNAEGKACDWPLPAMG